jgi:RNA polymerase sigma-70 factor (ECF subfamily)
MPGADVNQLVGHLFRQESGKMTAVLTRLLGIRAMEVAGDIVQDTLVKALSAWKTDGIPENPVAWLYTVAKRKAVDHLRQLQARQNHHDEINRLLKSEWTLTPTVNQFFQEPEIADSQLRMIFACCHPAIPYESQLALTLKTLCGLTPAEIAPHFLTTEETIAKRIYRAREKLREEKISLDAPAPAHLPGRLEAVLHTLYLLFSEGYNSSHPEQLIRADLCEEAMALCHLLTKHPVTNTPPSRALMALMCFQVSRHDARLDAEGSIILLSDQDRTRWSQPLIEKGKYYLEQASETDEVSEYHLEAAIAGCHASAPNFASTDWNTIEKIYRVLEKIKPGPIIQLNHAIAIRYAKSAREGMDALNKISGLFNHHLYYATKGDFLVELGNIKGAYACYEKASSLTEATVVKRLLRKKIDVLGRNP